MLSGPRLARPERPVRVGIEEEVEQVSNRQRDAAATDDAMPRLDAGEVAIDERCRLARHLDAVGGCVDGVAVDREGVAVEEEERIRLQQQRLQRRAVGRVARRVGVRVPLE